MLYFLQQCLNAVLVSALYGVLATAYVLVHGISGRVNLAFGTLAVWSGYITINVTLALMIRMPGETALPVLAAVLVALLNTAAVGLLIGQYVVGPLVRYGSLAVLIATLGLAIALEEFMRLINNSREVWLGPVLNRPIVAITRDGSTVQVTTIQCLVVGCALTLALGLSVLIARHPFGRVWRACSQDIDMARLCGIDVRRAALATFVLAALCAAVAGAMMAVYYGSVSFYGGLIIGLKTLFVAIVGGLHSVAGAFAGAFILGFLETFWVAYFDIAYRDVAVLLLLSGLMIAFPRGLFTGGGRIDHDL